MGCGATSNDASEDVEVPSGDPFARGQLIGVGNHGIVYRCRHQLKHQELAIKVISQLNYLETGKFSKQNYGSTLEMFKALSHPRLAQYKCAQLAGSQLSIIMQIGKQGTLKKYVQKQGKGTEQFAAGILRQILEGLLYLHTSSIVHGDIKSTNILMVGKELIKISDYGLAELYDGRLLKKGGGKEAKKKGQFFRGESVPYLAPEVILNQGATAKSDVWSVGCIAIEMLTGKTPWLDIAPTFQGAFKTIKNATFPAFPKGISKQCQDFLKGCLSVSPAKRSAVKDLLKHPFLFKTVSRDEVYFEIEKEGITLQSHNDKANRVAQIPNSNSKTETTMKTPSKGEKKYPNENSFDDRSSTRKVSKSSRMLKNGKEQVQIPETDKNKSVQRMSQVVEVNLVSKEDILPQINEDEDETNVVMLNNKKVRMRSPRVSYNAHMKTEPTYEKEHRNSITLEDSRLNDSFNEAVTGGGKKIDTEPTLLVADQETSKDYFKRPLKLLKKKIEDSKRKSKLNNNSNVSGSYTNQSSGKIELEKLYQYEKVSNGSKGRCSTEDRKDVFFDSNLTKREGLIDTDLTRKEAFIDTDLARKERDRYANQQVFMRKQREAEKTKWERELKMEAEHMKKQFSRRYAYPYPSIPF